MSRPSDKPPVDQKLLRRLPAVEELLESAELAPTIGRLGRPLVLAAARSVLERLRQDILAGAEPQADQLETAGLARAIAAEAEAAGQPDLIPLINATGVVVHTNLGRSILAPQAIAAVSEAAANYSNLEFSLKRGERGSRHDHITAIITRLTGAEDALVVNNNAAAVLLILSALAREQEVVVSRGELIEIGGSFRIPDIMASSGAKLVEVGTTNKTRLADFQKAIGPETAMLLHVHTSNYKVVGFTAEVPIAELVELGQRHDLLTVDDLGSGALAELPAFAGEPSIQESLAAGCDLVTFSGDKLLGGPQAGIIVGRGAVIKQLKSHPLARALRVDKMTLAALAATLTLYLNPERALAQIPTLRMLNEDTGSLKERAERLAALLIPLAQLASVEVAPAASKVGGGALPLLELESYVCAIAPGSLSVDELAARLRHTQPPLIGRIHQDRLLLDVRTILPEQLDLVAAALRQALADPAGS